MKLHKVVAVTVASVAVIAANSLVPAQGQPIPLKTAGTVMYRDYPVAGKTGGSPKDPAACALPPAKRTGNWVCRVASMPATFKPLSRSAAPAAAPYPIVVTKVGTWVQYANWSADYTDESFAYGVGTKILGYGSWNVKDDISGYAMETKVEQIRFSAAVVDTAFTAERLTTDKSANGLPISGTYQDVVIPSIPADTTANHAVNPKYDNSAKNMFVAHEISWHVSGYTGRWYTYMFTYIMHNTKIATGKYLYDIGGALPPNPEGGNYLL